MTEPVSASVVGRFPPPSSSFGLSIEPDLESYADDALHFLVIPHAPGVRVFASVGERTIGTPKSVPVPSGVVTFSGGKTASLPAPPYQSGPRFEVQLAMDAETGDPTSIGLSYDGQTNQLTATKNVHALVSYTAYQTIGLRVAYRPARKTLPIGFELEFGMLAAFRPPSTFATRQVTPFNIINGNAVYELYRIISNTVTTPAGEFERPNNYPTNPGTYTGSGFTLDVSVSMETERVLEIGYMDESGRGWVNSYHASALNPFVGDGSYTLPRTNRIANVTQFPRNLQQKALDFIASRGLGPR